MSRRLKSLRVRFTKPVYPGDELTCAGCGHFG